MIPRTHPNEDGFSYVDAILALLITTTIVFGSVLLLGKTPEEIVSRVRTEQEQYRYLQLWKYLRKELSTIQPTWWSSGPVVITSSNHIKIQASRYTDSSFIVIEANDNIISVETPEEEIRFSFHSVPTWTFVDGVTTHPDYILLSHKTLGPAIVPLGGMPIRSRRKNPVIDE